MSDSLAIVEAAPKNCLALRPTMSLRNIFIMIRTLNRPAPGLIEAYPSASQLTLESPNCTQGLSVGRHGTYYRRNLECQAFET